MNDESGRSLLRAAGIGALVFVAVMAFGGSRWLGGGRGGAIDGGPAPEVTAQIVAGDGTGDRVTLSSLRGQVVMLDFWASWCPPCRESLPIVSAVATRHPGLVTYAVNVEADQPVSRVVAAHRALHIGVPTLLDADYSAQSAFSVEALPTLVLIDREGNVRHYSTGVPDERELDAEIEALLR